MAENEKYKTYTEFLDRVKKLAEDNGYRASLRRSAGKLLNIADGKAVVNFYNAYPPTEYYEDQCFFVACVQCFWEVKDLSKARPLAQTASHMDAESREVVKKRIESLLDLSWEQDGYFATKLLRLIKFCQSKGFVIDCKTLLEDLVQWDYESRSVQKRWIRDFYNLGKEKQQNKEQNEQEKGEENVI